MNTYELKLTSAMVIEGGVVRAGTRVRLDEATAKDFLRRGKAELVSEPAKPTEQHQDDDQEQDINLDRLNKAQLLEVADQMGVEASDDMTKAQIIEAINGAAEND